MSEENVEVVRAVLDAFVRRDWDGSLKHQTPDFEIDLSRGVGPASGIYRRDQVQELWSDFGAHWASWRIEPHEFVEAGEHVVVPGEGSEAKPPCLWSASLRGPRVG